MEAVADFAGRAKFFRAVTDWWASGTERYFLLGGGVGTGKTTAMAQFVTHGAPPVVARHFCDPADLSTRNPQEVARALSVQLAEQIAGFTDSLVGLDRTEGRSAVTGVAMADQVHPGAVNAGVFVSTLIINAPSDEAAWNRTVTAPLRRLASQSRLPPVLVAVDALDEADLYDGQTKVTDLVLGAGADLSEVRWLVSTRYPERVATRLPARDVRYWDLSAGEGGEETRRDARAFLARELRLGTGSALRLAEQRADGNFLHARLLVETVRAHGETDAQQLAKVLEETPSGLDGIQSGYLRQIVASDRQLGWLNGYRPVLSGLVVAQEPLDLATLARLSGIQTSLVKRVLIRIHPLLNPDPDSDQQHYSLYHAQFREFLAHPTRAGEWWCDPEEAHQRVTSAYEKQTETWTRWEKLDGYGAQHLLVHARGAGWTAADFDRAVVPAYIARVAEEPDAVAAVLRLLDVPIGVALAEPEPVRAFVWSWAVRRIKDTLIELLGTQMPTLLIKAGHADLVVASLSLTADSANHSTRLASAVSALAAEGHLSLVRTIVSLAPREGRSRLLVVAAGALADLDPNQARTLVEDAGTPEDFWGGMALEDRWGFRESDRMASLLTALASVPTLAQWAADLSGGMWESLNAVVLGLARWDPRQAVDIAVEHNLPACAAAFEALVASDPGQARALLDRLEPDNRITIMLRYQDALKTGFSRRWILGLFPLRRRRRPRRGAQPDSDLLLLAAALTHDPNDRELRTAAQAVARWLPPGLGAVTDPPSPWPTISVENLAKLDLVALSREPLAARIAASVVFRVLQAERSQRGELDVLESYDVASCGHLCAALTALDPLAADAAIEVLMPNDGRDLSESFGVALVGSLCGRDPRHAWELAGRFGTHWVYRAWVKALPESHFEEGVRNVASLDARYSGTRAELAGLLAAKLPRGEKTRARELLRLATPLAEGSGFREEYDALSAALAPQSDWGDTLVPRLMERFGHMLRDGAKADVQELPDAERLPAIANYMAAWTGMGTYDGIALLAATAVEASRDADHDGRQTRELLQACLNPSYGHRSMPHSASWFTCARAVRLAYECWQGTVSSPDDFVGMVVDRMPDSVAVMILALLLDHLPHEGRVPVFDATARLNPRVGRALEGTLIVCQSEQPPDAWLRRFVDLPSNPTFDDEASDPLYRDGIHMALVTLAGRNPQGALNALADGTGGWPAWYLGGADTSHRLVSVLPAIAKADRDLALDVANGLCTSKPHSAVGRHALHTVALTVAEEDWHVGLRIARSIDFAQVRGPALGSLAQEATRLRSPRERHRAYAAVVETATKSNLADGVDSIVLDLVTALSGDTEPPPDIVAWLIPKIMSDRSTRRPRHLADLAVIVARYRGVDANADLRSVEALVTAAWNL
ncbi:P-loop domain-containing protein [Streptomyces mirabilis]|uniref:hypothetical protein n=1 Tax=Streptomyces mirabilis TaxID=68239 RepID=UPI00333464F8